MLGVDHGSNTTIHLYARINRESATGGKNTSRSEGWEPVRFEYRKIDHCCSRISPWWMAWLDRRGLQGGEKVGNAKNASPHRKDRGGCDGTAKRDHIPAPEGVDEECDDAWMSLLALSGITVGVLVADELRSESMVGVGVNVLVWCLGVMVGVDDGVMCCWAWGAPSA